jgi:hypothetical protein
MSGRLPQEVEGSAQPTHEATPAIEDDSDPDIDELDGMETLAVY